MVISKARTPLSAVSASSLYNLYVSILDSTRSLKDEIIDDIEINKELDAVSYELGHIRRKLEIHTDSAYSTFLSLGSGPRMRNSQRKKIVNHLLEVRPRIVYLIKKLEQTNSKKLHPSQS